MNFRLWSIAFLFMLCAAGVAGAEGWSDEEMVHAVADWSGGEKAFGHGDEKFKVMQEQKVGDYRVVIDGNEAYTVQRLKIFRNDRLLYIKEGYRFRLGLTYEEMPDNALVAPGKDITGDGEPDLVVSHWSGGAHCCFSFDIFTIGKAFKYYDTIDSGDGDMSVFRDVDRDGALECQVRDWTFAYWNASFGTSPSPEVVLKFRDGRYVPDMGSMRKPELSARQEKKILREIAAQRAEDMKLLSAEKDDEGFDPMNYGWARDGVYVPPLVWEHLLDLIYTGHGAKAKGFLAKTWPAGKTGQDVFWNDFMEKFADSPYCYALQGHYGNDLPVLCNKQTRDFGDAGFSELRKRIFMQEIAEKRAREQAAEPVEPGPVKVCTAGEEGCS